MGTSRAPEEPLSAWLFVETLFRPNLSTETLKYPLLVPGYLTSGAVLPDDKSMGSAFYYKYTDHHAVNVLSDLRLKVTPPNEFNDPFEFLPHITATMTLPKAKKALKRKPEQRKLYNLWLAGGYNGSFRDFKILAKSPEMSQKTVQLFPEKLTSYKENYQMTVSEDHGVLCLCKNPSSILMWSHYADRHKGAVIALYSQHDFFTKAGVKEVEYNDERVPFDPTWERTSPAFSLYKDAIIRRKSKHWGYEDELRMLWRLECCESSEDKGLRLYFCKIPRELIAKIIFGLRCPPEMRTQIRAKAENQGLKIQFEEAYIHESKFELLFRTV